MLRPLALELIQAGDLQKTVENALDKISKDIYDRPALEKARTLTIEVKVTPKGVPDPGGSMPRCMPDIDWQVKHRLPAEGGMTTRAILEGDRLMVNANDPLGDVPGQGTLYDAIEDQKKGG